MHPDHRRDLGYPRGKHNTQQIAVCVNEYIARQAREIFGPNYMKDIYYPKENTMTCVMRTIEKAIEHAKTIQRSPVM